MSSWRLYSLLAYALHHYPPVSPLPQVQELHEEEAQWVNYDEDELFVKMQLADSIFDMLLKDTADVLTQIHEQRSARDALSWDRSNLWLLSPTRGFYPPHPSDSLRTTRHLTVPGLPVGRRANRHLQMPSFFPTITSRQRLLPSAHTKHLLIAPAFLRLGLLCWSGSFC